MDKWKSIEPQIWKPGKTGDQIIGVLVSKEEKNEQAQLSARYYLETMEGMYFLWGSAVLDDRMQYVKVGDKIRITYEGQTKNKRNQKVNLYKVEVAEKPDDNAEDNKNGCNDLEEVDIEV